MTQLRRRIASVSLGFKSLQNQFFYVSKDEIKEYGIEKKYLQPIFQLGDLEADKYKQTIKPVQWVFYCKDKEADLRGTGALRYIRAMENYRQLRRSRVESVRLLNKLYRLRPAQVGCGMRRRHNCIRSISGCERPSTLSIALSFSIPAKQSIKDAIMFCREAPSIGRSSQQF
jgi:hypothetical protein